MALTGDRSKTPRHVRDITGQKYVAAQANAAANREIRLAMGQDPAGYVERVTSEARRTSFSEGWNRGYDQAYPVAWDRSSRVGWDDAVDFLIDKGLITQEVYDAAVDAHNAGIADGTIEARAYSDDYSNTKSADKREAAKTAIIVNTEPVVDRTYVGR